MQKKNSSIRKRIFSLLLAAVMALSSTATAFAAEDITTTDVSTVEITEEGAEQHDISGADATQDESAEAEQFEEYHFVSHIDGEGMCPYEYYIIDCSDIETNESVLDIGRVPSYYSSQTKYNSSFAYDELAEDEQAIYDSLYALASEIDASADYDATYMSDYKGYFYDGMKYADSSADRDTLYKVYVALTNDNPQFFWMGHSYLSGSSSGGAYFYFGVDSADYADGTDRMSTRAALYEEIESALEGAAAYGNEYTKEWYIHNYLCDKTTYVLGAEHAHDITGLLLDGEAVCESYAKCFQLFMNALNIDVMYITGIGNGGNHAWNQVGLDNNGTTEWYNVDVTWDDDDDGYTFHYFNAVDSDGTAYDFTKGFTQNGTTYNAHVALTAGDTEYIYPAKVCNSTTYSYSNHSLNYALASVEPVAKIGTTEYTSLDAAIAASTADQTITLLDNVAYTGATMPEHALTIDCAGFCIEFPSAMDMNADLTIDNISGHDFDKLYGNGNPIYNYNYIYLNGNKLTLNGAMAGYLPVLISGYVMNEDETEIYESGTVQIDLDEEHYCSLIQAVGLDDLTIAQDEIVNIHFGFDASDVVINDNATLSIDHGYGEMGCLSIAEDAWLRVASTDPEPFFIIYDIIDGDVVNVSAANMEEGLASVATRLKYPADLFNFVYLTADGETAYKVSRVINDSGVYLYMPCATADYTISDGAKSAERCTFAEAIEYIEEQNDATKDYTITFTGSEEITYIENDITFTSKAKSITYGGNSLVLAGNVTLDTDLIFTTGCNFYRGSLNGNGCTVTFDSCANTSAFNGCAVSDVAVVVNGSSVSFIDTESTGKDVQLNSFALIGDADIGIADVDLLQIDELIMSGENNRISFNSGKTVIGDITSAGNSWFNIYNGDVITIVGSVTLSDSTPISIYSTSATSGQKIMTVSEDLSEHFTTDVTNNNGNTYSVVYRGGTLIYDIPVFELEGVGVFSQWSDVLATINKAGSASSSFTVTLLDDAVIDNLTLPASTKADSITFDGEHTLTVNNDRLTITTDTSFNCALNAVNTGVTVAKGMTLAIESGNVKSVTGTSTSTLVCGTLNTGDIKTFGTVDVETLTLGGPMSGVNSFSGELVPTSTASTATITKISDDSKISYMTGDTLPKVTVSGIADGATIIVNVNDGKALTGGYTVLYCTSDISGSVVIENMNEGGKALSPIYYASAKCIKAEDASAVTMFITDADGDEATRHFPTVELALTAIKDSGSDYRIVLNQPFTIANLTLPKTANSVTFEGEQLTLNNKTLAVNINTVFNCKLVAPNTAVTVAKGKFLTLTDAEVKSIKGTATSDLNCTDLTVTDINTFNYVICDGLITLEGKVAGVKSFAGKADAVNAASTIAITNIIRHEDINNQFSLYNTNGKLAKLTVTSIADDADLAVAICDSVGALTTIESGTAVMYSAGKDITDRITILNTTPEAETLKPYYYSKTIKAEWPDAVTLSYNGESTNYPNLDKVFEVITAAKDSTTDYTITLNTPVTLSKLTLPKYANSITFTGSALTFTGTTLKLTLNTYFDSELIAENTALTVAKDLRLADASLKSLAGAKVSALVVTGEVITPSVKTFASVDASAGELVISGTANGITSFSGNLTASAAKANITITSANYADITLIADSIGTVGKITINNAADDATIAVKVVDESGDVTALASGTPLLFCSSDISERITIENKTSSDNALSASYYAKKKAVYAEYANAVEASYSTESGSVNEYYSSFENAFAAIPTTAEDITLYLNCDVVAESFTVPKFVNGLTINGLGNAITLNNLAAVSLAVPAEFIDITIDSTKAFKINTTADLTLSSFYSSTLSGVTGKATNTLCYYGENDVNYTVSGFGILDLATGPVLNISKDITGKTVNADNNAVLGILSGANVKLTTVNCDTLVIKYYDGATTPVSISGAVTGKIGFVHDTSFNDGQQLLTAAKVDPSSLSFEEANLPDDRDYILTIKSGKVYLKAIAFEVSNGTNGYRFADWADFITMVNAEKNAEATYTVTLTGDHNVGAAFTMPKAGTYSKIVISSPEEEAYTLSFTGGIKLTGELELKDIILSSVNSKGAAAAYTITTGKYSLTATYVDFGTSASITGSTGSVITLDSCALSGKLTAVDAVLCDTTVTGAVKTTKTLTIDGFAEFGNTVNAYGLDCDSECTIALTKGKLLTVGKGGTGEGTIYISLSNTEITAKTKLGTITKGYYNENFVGDGFDLSVDSNVINAYPI